MMLPLVLALAFLSQVGACKELSGRYVHAGEDNRVYVSIVQTRCERIAITWDTSWPPARVPVRLVLDGRFHPTNPGWFGFHQISTSLDDTTLKIVMVGQSPGDTTNPYTIRLTLLADGDLCVTDSTSMPSQPYSRYSRQHVENSDEAARRSEQGCSVR
jgi:hypothetical protein